MARVFRYGIVVLAAVLFSGQALAARQVIPEPGSVQRTWVPGSGPTAFVDSRDWNATVSTQSGARVEVPVTGKRSYGWPKWRAGAKALIKGNAASAAATVAFAGMFAGLDWLMSDGAISKPTNVLVDAPDMRYRAAPGHPSSQYKPTALEACQQYESICSSGLGSYTRTNGLASISPYTTGQFACFYKRQTRGSYLGSGQYEWNDAAPSYQCGNNPGATLVTQGECPSGSVLDMSAGGCVKAAYSPVTDADIDGALADVSDPSFAADTAPVISENVPGSFDYPDGFEFDGPESIDLPGVITTSTDASTGSTTTTEILPSVQFEYGTEPWSITPTDKTTKNTYKDGQKTQTEESVSTEPQNNSNVSIQPKSEIPTDCAFMPTVCKFIDWVKTPFNPEEPDFSQFIEDKDFTQEVNFSGNATCPPPTVIATSHGNFEFSWQPACDWAGLIKPLVILAALIGALYISVGAVRND